MLQQWQELAAHAADQGVEFLSSPFSIEAVELLEGIGVGAYKVPSGEVTNLPLLERIATRYDKTAQSFLSMICTACLMVWIR